MSEKKSIFNLTFFITSLLCLVPIAVGFILWDKLPESIPQQYGYNDEATWSLPKLWGIITLPIFMFIINLVMHLIITFSKKEYNQKVVNVTYWIIPILACTVGIFMLLKPIGINIETFQFVAIILGILFMIIGNYLPKTEPNHLIGVRAPWTMNNPEVWRKVHRVSGFVLVLLGLFILITCFTPIGKVAFIAATAFAVIFMLVYSIVMAVKYNKKEN